MFDLASFKARCAVAQSVSRRVNGLVSSPAVLVWLENGLDEHSAITKAEEEVARMKAEAHSSFVGRSLHIQMTRLGLAQ